MKKVSDKMWDYIFFVILLSLSNTYARIKYDTLLFKNEKIAVCTTYFDDGAVESITSEINGEFHGKQIRYHKNGKIAWVARYNKGIIIDTSFHFFSSGKIESIATSSFYVNFNEKGDTIAFGKTINDKVIGLHRIYYSAHRPKQFTHYNDSGLKHGWEVFWYDNGNVKDSTLYRNDTVIKGKDFFYNGKLATIEENVNTELQYSATSYDIKGKKTGVIKNGTGTIYSCDSLGNNCHKIVYRNGKYMFKESD